MTTSEIAHRLVDLSRAGLFEDAQKELFADDIVSIEPNDIQGFEKIVKGKQAIVEKGHKFQQMVETVHEIKVSEPLVSGNAIAFILDMDTTMKGMGRSQMKEICLYQVKDGKIVSEQFFF